MIHSLPLIEIAKEGAEEREDGPSAAAGVSVSIDPSIIIPSSQQRSFESARTF